RHHAEQPHLAVHGRQGTGGIGCAAMADDGAVERELFEVGRKLAAALPTTRNPLKALDDKAMDLASSDAELKAALFRFVDVVPASRSRWVARAPDAARWAWPRRQASSTWRTGSSWVRTRGQPSACCAICGRT